MIVMLLEGEYPKDIRVRKEAESLAEAGEPVTVFCYWKTGLLRHEIVNGVQVFRVGKNTTFRQLGLRDTFNAIFVFNRLLYKAVLKFAKSNPVKAIHVHDLHLAKTGFCLRRKLNVPVVLDMHENFPEMLEERFIFKKTLFKRIKDNLLFKPSRWKRVEARLIPKMDYVIAVVEEMKTKLHQLFPNFKDDQIIVISNYEKNDFDYSETIPDFEFIPEFTYITYVGGISPVRGLDTVIEALTILNKEESNFKFLIVGSGNDAYLNVLKDLAVKHGQKDNVIFLGQKPFTEINYYMKKSKINIIPHIKNDHTDYTIPHKLFQLMQSKTTILVSNCLPLKRVIFDTNSGFVFTASSAQSLSDEVLKILALDKEVIDSIQQNAHNSAKQLFSWEKEGLKLVNHYKNLK